MYGLSNAYLIDGVRSPFGRHAGSLSHLRPDDLAAQTIASLLQKHPSAAAMIEDVLLGCTCQAGEDSRNIARHAALLAGLPMCVAGQTINRLCASGLAAVASAANSIKLAEGDLMLAGGVESMSRAPFVFGKSESAFGREIKVFDSSIGPRFPNPRISHEFGSDSMAETADNVAQMLGIRREQADAFAAQSQARYASALAAGFFAEEICAIELRHGKQTSIISADEHPRPSSTMEALTKLKPLNPHAESAVTTAGNASGINDGAVALLLGTQSAADAIQVAPMARIIASAVSGIAPRIMGLGPVEAIQKILRRTGLNLAEMDVIEINEAFSAQVLGCLQQLGLESSDPRINPNGGAIAIGHPLGASGARLVLTAARQLQRCGGRFALVSLCVGVGQGMAMVLQRA